MTAAIFGSAVVLAVAVLTGIWVLRGTLSDHQSTILSKITEINLSLMQHTVEEKSRDDKLTSLLIELREHRNRLEVIEKVQVLQQVLEKASRLFGEHAG